METTTETTTSTSTETSPETATDFTITETVKETPDDPFNAPKTAIPEDWYLVRQAIFDGESYSVITPNISTQVDDFNVPSK